jgi:hypothetical protein
MVYFEDFKTGDIEHTNEELPFCFDIQCDIDTLDQPTEDPIVNLTKKLQAELQQYGGRFRGHTDLDRAPIELIT